MSLPDQLTRSFVEIQKSDLVRGTVSDSTVQQFVRILNKAIPSTKNRKKNEKSVEAYALYKFIRSLYLSDKQKFLGFIEDSIPFNSMILWTDFQDILKAFHLTGKMFLGWDKNNKRYHGFILNNSKLNTTPKTPPSSPVSQTTSSTPSLVSLASSASSSSFENLPSLEQKAEKSQDEEEGELIFENLNDDMDRVYSYMQARLSALSKTVQECKVE